MHVRYGLVRQDPAPPEVPLESCHEPQVSQYHWRYRDIVPSPLVCQVCCQLLVFCLLLRLSLLYKMVQCTGNIENVPGLACML